MSEMKLTARQMGTQWSREVKRLVMHLVNERDIRYRVIDGDHMLLYPPDGEGRPFKIASKRDGFLTERFLREQFMHDNNIPDEDGNVPTGRYGTTEEAVAPESTEEPAAAPGASSQASDPREAVLTLARALGVNIETADEECAKWRERAENAEFALAEMTEQRDELLAETQQKAQWLDNLRADNDGLMAQIVAAREALA